MTQDNDIPRTRTTHMLEHWPILKQWRNLKREKGSPVNTTEQGKNAKSFGRGVKYSQACNMEVTSQGNTQHLIPSKTA